MELHIWHIRYIYESNDKSFINFNQMNMKQCRRGNYLNLSKWKKKKKKWRVFCGKNFSHSMNIPRCFVVIIILYGVDRWYEAEKIVLCFCLFFFWFLVWNLFDQIDDIKIISLVGNVWRRINKMLTTSRFQTQQQR